MEIMRFVADQVREKSKLYYGVLIAGSILTVVLAFGKIVTFSDLFLVGVPWDDDWDPQWFLYFQVAGTIFATIIVWLYYAPIVYDILNKLKDIFQCEEYSNLFEEYQGWMQQFNFKTNGRSPKFKRAYLLFWGLFLLLFIVSFPRSAFAQCGFHWILQGIFVVMSGILIVLNFSSYYICIVFVYFLMRLCRLERETKLDYIKQYPSSTYGFQVLSQTFDIISLYFLLDSLFCSVTYFSFWQMASKAGYKPKTCLEYWTFLYVTLFMVVFGLASWLYIILVSRVYLNRLHRRWKLRSYQLYEEMYRQNQWQSDTMDHILEDIDRLNRDKITMKSWEMLISLLAVAANLVTAASVFGNLPFGS